jgi:hypothetical protein
VTTLTNQFAANAALRAAIRRVARRGAVETKHYYRREG